MKYFCFLLVFASAAFSEMNLFQATEPKISVQNTVLAKVNGNIISVLDVMKKMDLVLHQNYPQYADSAQARLQFYASSWRPVFMEMINTELILSDAQDKEVKIADGEVREEMESRFGPNVLATLEKIGVTYEDAWKMIKNDLIVHRMNWFFVQSKAMQNVSPGAIREAYRGYISQHPPCKEWIYRVISIRSDTEDAEMAKNIHDQLVASGQTPESAAFLKDWESAHPGCKVQISNEFSAKDQELSDAHRSGLESLNPGTYSNPVCQMSRVDQKNVYRIFYLAQKNDHPAPSFDSLAGQMKNELLQKAVVKESAAYIQKLQKHYGFDPSRIKETVPDDFAPFHLE